MRLLLHGFHLSDLYPSYSAGLNKSHQAGSDSSYVDRMPNVIWRLGEHGIGPNSALLCDVILSLDESAQSRSLTHIPASAQNSQKHALTQSAWLTYYPLSAKRGPSVQTPHTPLRLFVLFFMFHFPSTHPWSLLSLQSLSCIHAQRAASASWLSHINTHMNGKTQINKLMYMLAHTTSRPSHTHTNIES